MHSAASASELRLGELGAEALANRPDSLSLLGGLGLGFTLKGLLQGVGLGARVQVAELIPDVVAWNRTLLTNLNGHLLDDSRVEVVFKDVWTVIRNASPAQYDILALDIDNGPAAMVKTQNSRLYDFDGLQRIARVLKPGGRALVWSADTTPGFIQRLVRAGFQAKIVPAPRYAGAKRCAISIYVADKAADLGNPV
jgi:spermidine synthase